MKIGELAKITGVKAPTIRFYEDIGLLPEPDRTGGNYRAYAQEHVLRLNFIRKARALGFELPDVRSLLELSDPGDRDCDDIVRIATAHREEVDRKAEQLARLRRELDDIVAHCRTRLNGGNGLLRCFSEAVGGGTK